MKQPPSLLANEIQAMYMQMLNSGQNAVGEIGKGYISIEEWRDRELRKIGAIPNGETGTP